MITELLKMGFSKFRDEDYDCILRIHELHYLFWSEKLKHFALAVKNDTGKKEAGGYYREFKTIIIPKPMYSIEDAKKLINAFV